MSSVKGKKNINKKCEIKIFEKSVKKKLKRKVLKKKQCVREIFSFRFPT